MSITGMPGGPPVKIGVPVTDLGAALFATSAILAALFHRERTGRGQYIDTSLLDAGVAMSVWEATEFFNSHSAPQPMGSAHRMSAPYQAIRCSDGYITIAAANDRLFQRLSEVLQQSSWLTDRDFLDDTQRVRNRERLAREIESVTLDRPREYWLRLFEQAGIPCGPINNYEPVFEDSQVRARSLVVDTEHPTLGRIRTLGAPVKMSLTPSITGRPAPLLGQHTREVLREIGYSDEDVSRQTQAL